MLGTSKDRSPRALVTDVQFASAVEVVRSLGRRGWHVVAASPDPLAPGAWSRFTSRRLRYPDPQQDAEAALGALARATHDLEIDVLIPVTEDVALVLDGARDRLAPGCRLALPSTEALAVAGNKEATLSLATRLGIPVPRTIVVNTIDEARDAARQLGWPVVVKPAAARVLVGTRVDALSVAYAADERTLTEHVTAVAGRCPILLQERCAGDAHGVELLLADGHPLAAFQHRRVREVPLTGGPSSSRESVALDPVLYSYAAALLGDLEWTGLAMVEFKVADDGPQLMEINGRIWGSLPLALRAGMDFPGRLAELCLWGAPDELPPFPDVDYQVGVTARNVERELRWLASALRRGGAGSGAPDGRPAVTEVVKVAVGLLAPTRTDIFSSRDALPGVAEVARIARKASRKVSHSA